MTRALAAGPASAGAAKASVPQSDDQPPTALMQSPERFFNRELSWLAFNERVLDQARDSRWPLLERCKFLAIHGANLDEFYMIRVSGLHEQLDASVVPKQADGLEVRDLLAQIRKLAQRQLHESASLYLEVLVPELAAAGIRITRFRELAEADQAWARESGSLAEDFTQSSQRPQRRLPS